MLYSGDPAVHTALRRTLASLGAPRDATILHAYEERWPQIVRQWREGLEADGLRLVAERELECPPQLAGRRLVLEELRLTDERLFSTPGEEAS